MSRYISAAELAAPPASRGGSLLGRFVDRGAITAAFVGLGVAVVTAISFLLIIPIDPIYWLLSLPAGLLVGYYANTKAGRRREWRRIIANGLFSGAVTGLTLALLLLGIKALFFYADSGYPNFNRVDQATGVTIPPTCVSGADCVYQRYLVDQGDALRRAGVTDATSFAKVYWDQQLSTALTLLLAATGGGVAGGLVFGLTRPKPGSTIEAGPFGAQMGTSRLGRHEFKDVAIRELSEMLIKLPEDPTPGLELLDPARLDYSIESLTHLDDYLELMRTRELAARDTAVVVLRSGAYVGEVIRRNSTGHTYHWLDYEGAVAIEGLVGELGSQNVGVAAVLWDGHGGFVFPLAKVLKFLENGREDATAFFAAAIVAIGAN